MVNIMPEINSIDQTSTILVYRRSCSPSDKEHLDHNKLKPNLKVVSSRLTVCNRYIFDRFLTNTIARYRWCILASLQWRHNRRDGVSNPQPYHCLLNHWFGRKSKKTSKLRVTGLCAANSPVTGEFPAQMAIWWRHHASVENERHEKLLAFRLWQ